MQAAREVARPVRAGTQHRRSSCRCTTAALSGGGSALPRRPTSKRLLPLLSDYVAAQVRYRLPIRRRAPSSMRRPPDSHTLLPHAARRPPQVVLTRFEETAGRAAMLGISLAAFLELANPSSTTGVFGGSAAALSAAAAAAPLFLLCCTGAGVGRRRSRGVGLIEGEAPAVHGVCWVGRAVRLHWCRTHTDPRRPVSPTHTRHIPVAVALATRATRRRPAAWGGHHGLLEPLIASLTSRRGSTAGVGTRDVDPAVHFAVDSVFSSEFVR